MKPLRSDAYFHQWIMLQNQYPQINSFLFTNNEYSEKSDKQVH